MRVALIGDSQSEALWPRVKKLLPSLEFVLTRTQRGWAESHYHNEGKLAQELKDAKPELVVIELGGNNAAVTEAKYKPHVDWILEAARASGAKNILYFGPAAATKEPYKSNKEWTRSFQSQYLPKEAKVTWRDSFPHTQTGQVDGVHFNGGVYNAWAAVMAPLILKTVQSSPSLVAAVPRWALWSGAGLVSSLTALVVIRRMRRNR
jgi:lysophospholipase L1-like esterase